MPRPLAAAARAALATLAPLATLATLATLAAARTAHAQPTAPPRVLVFSRTAAFRHASIPAGKAALLELGAKNGLAVDTTEDAGRFTDAGLAPYRLVVFLSTTGNVLDDAQQAAFERWLRAGHGWVGIHAAADTEYDWPWYGRLAGAYFAGHPGNPNVRQATFVVVDERDPATQGLPERWPRTDEFYNFRSIQPDLHVLVTIDESTYQGGTNGASHPMSWYHAVDGGRAFYTAMGHTDETFADPLFLRHLLGGMRWALGAAR